MRPRSTARRYYSSTSPFGLTHPPQPHADESVPCGPLIRYALVRVLLQLQQHTSRASLLPAVVVSCTAKQHGAWRHGRCSVFISHLFFVVFFPILFNTRCLVSSPLDYLPPTIDVTQIRGHKARPSPSFPPCIVRFTPCTRYFYHENT